MKNEYKHTKQLYYNSESQGGENILKLQEIVDQVKFLIGIPATDNVEDIEPEKAVMIAFRQLKDYMKTPVDKTVPYSHRIDLITQHIRTTEVIDVKPAYPRIGYALSPIDSGNVFQVAAAANVYNNIGNTSALNIDPIMTEMAMAQVRNTLSNDFQWRYDQLNQIVYCTHRDPMPTVVTITYVPDFEDVSEIRDRMWINYLIRLSEAYMKKSLGRVRSKYTVQGSNVTYDGETLLNEANTELQQIQEELDKKKTKLVLLN